MTSLTNTNTNNSKPYRPNVGIMLINDKGEILIGERNDIPGAWQMPQGGIEEGEDIIAAARRELGEETGIASALTDFIKRTNDWLYYDYPTLPSPSFWLLNGHRQGKLSLLLLLSSAPFTKPPLMSC